MKNLSYFFFIGLMGLLLAACGGGPPAPPTAIPPSVAQPEQPSPELSRSQPVFNSANASPTVIIVPDAPETISALADAEGGTPEPIQLQFKIPPSAMGIATGGTTVVDEPGGSVLATVPAGSTLTVTGRSADGDFLAVYDDSGLYGWVAAGSLKLFGAEDLTIVEGAISPAPVVTLMAEAMQPLETSAIDDAIQAMMQATPVIVATPQP